MTSVTSRKKIIFFELNEVPYRVIDEYCRCHPASFLARTLPACHQFETVAADETSLSPWKTWPTMHRGVPDSQHMIHDFGQDLGDVNREYPPIWELLRARGVMAGLCGSLHSYPLPSAVEEYSFYLPDTFAAGAECFPKALSRFQAFNLEMARESARNVSKRVPWRSALDLLAGAGELGLRASTWAAVGGQLVSERLNPARKSRRRTFQTVLAFDIFMRQLERTRPEFATFFTNHVA
ncbi:MAG: hypothetical protein ACRD96_21260, partial [Bryobacteraceae bacterium]